MVADYSQIELRLLAHMSRDPVLLEAFRNGEDIHTRTAAEVLDVPPLMVTPGSAPRGQGGQFRHRLRHQPVRPGGAVGHLARRGRSCTSTTTSQRYAGVRRFIDDTIAEVRQTGVTQHAVRARAAHPRYEQPQPERARIRGAHGGQLRRCRARRRT